MIKVLFFAGLRESAQTNSINVSSEGITSIRELVAKLGELLPKELAQALADETAMVSVDQVYAGWGASISDGAEVGFLPPVSGG